MSQCLTATHNKQPVFSSCQRHIQASVISQETQVTLFVIPDATIDHYRALLTLEWIDRVYPHIVWHKPKAVTVIQPPLLQGADLAPIRGYDPDFTSEVGLVMHIYTSFANQSVQQLHNTLYLTLIT